MSTVDADTIERLRHAALQQPGARERASGYVKFQCPQCRDDGHDKHRDNAGLYLRDGTWGCAFASGTPALGRAHWDAIGCVLGALSNGHVPHVTATEPKAEPISATETPYTFTSAFPPEHFVSRFITYGAQCADAAHDYLETVALGA